MLNCWDRVFQPCFAFLGGASLSFNGNSYVKYRLIENENKEEMKLSLRLRTYHPHAVVMYARGTDYSILEVCAILKSGQNIAQCYLLILV